jgi:hypothetical protein
MQAGKKITTYKSNQIKQRERERERERERGPVTHHRCSSELSLSSCWQWSYEGWDLCDLIDVGPIENCRQMKEDSTSSERGGEEGVGRMRGAVTRTVAVLLTTLGMAQ